MTGMTIRSASNAYGCYAIPEGCASRPAARAVLSGGIYEPETLDFMRRYAGRGDIVHAGTFFGDFLPALASALAPTRRLWAFEPNPVSVAAAHETITLNGLRNVTLTHAALSNRAGALHFRTHRSDGRPLGGLSQVVDSPGPGVETVPAAMLDFVVPQERPLGIIQLDVEGHEKPALKGAYHLIHRWRPLLILEHFEAEGWITRTFRGLGYRRIGALHGNTVFATEPMVL
ncbi:FkbM family methyltransferase [Cognatishimia sp. F0-27]|uniref:FkbM family methyltransferase n=1 Tax=Cognatishimia sp. F0-27 TaxID=2816855 RepID=UPI001D0C5C69|nr:FkbM family methyltransferase [Cognatishimia sp. F0-27]MCC1491198.1 FkbM family methyltransferase [Cognatishimia sp. F0-27]